MNGNHLSIAAEQIANRNANFSAIAVAVALALVAGDDLSARAATLSAGNNLSLSADHQIRLLAAHNTADQDSTRSHGSASVGVSIGTDGLLLNVGASGGRGKADGADSTWRNSDLAAGHTLTLVSGGDTTLRGAVASGQQVIVRVGTAGSGDLLIESQQDSSTFDSKQQSAGFSLSVGPGRMSGSASASQGRIESDFLSVGAQSGIQAGDGGFQVAVTGDTDLKGAVIASTQRAVDTGKNTFTTGGTLTLDDLQNRAEYHAQSISIGLGAGSLPGQSLSAGLSGVGIGSEQGSARSTTRAAISGIAGNTAARTGDAEQGLKPIFDVDRVQAEIQAQVTITQEFGKQAGKAISDYANDQRKELQAKAQKAGTPEEKVQAEQAIKDVNMQERALNILAGALTGSAGSVVTKEALSVAAEKMRELMIEDSMKFAGVVDSTGYVLNNINGPSSGIRGDGKKVGGTRVDLDLLCGTGNERCKANPDGSLELNSGRVQFDNKKAGMSLEKFLETPEGRKMAGDTGGVQGVKGTLFGVPYEPGSWQDKLIEAFAGTHDFVGGKSSGLYDAQGNIKRGMSDLERLIYDKGITTGAIPIAAPFAAAEGMSTEVWKALSILLGAAK